MYIRLLFALCINWSVSFGQSMEGKYSIQNFTDEHGLPQNSVKSINADNMGFIWLCTEAGLARFDGRNIVNFTNVGKAVDAVKFFNVLPDMYGSKNRFYAARHNMSSIRIQNAMALYDSTFNYDELLNRLSLKNNSRSLIEFGAPGIVGEDLPEYIELMFLPAIGREGCFYKISREQISFFDKWQLHWSLKNEFGVVNRFFIHDGRLHHLNDAKEILRLDKQHWNRISLVGDIVHHPAGAEKYKVIPNLINEQIFLLINNRFYQLHPDKGNSWKTTLLLEDFSFESNHIRSAYYEAKSGNLLLGSLAKGLFVIRRDNFMAMRNGEDDRDNVVYSQIALDSNRILLPNGKVHKIARKGAGISIGSRETAQQVMLPASDMRYMLRDRDGRIWVSIGTMIKCYSPDGERLLQTYSFDDAIAGLFEAPGAEIIAGVKSRGLYRLFSDGSKPVPFLPGWTSIYDIYMIPAENGNIWLGTDKGLFQVNTKMQKRRLIPGTEKLHIRSILQAEKNGAIFFTTFDEGIFYYDGYRIIQLPLDKRGYMASAHCIVKDTRGYFWVTTNKGLFQISTADLYRYAEEVKKSAASTDLFYLYYKKTDGFATNEFNGGCQPCSIRLQNDVVSLPSINGLVLFEPEKVQPNLPDGKFVVDRIEEGNSTRLIFSDTVHLALNPKNVRFFLNIPYFGNNENLHFSYAMMRNGKTPEHGDWITVNSTDLTIGFSELSSGQHRLWVRKWNGFGKDNFAFRVVDVFVPLNWYETLWFKMLIGFTSIILIFLITRIRTRSLQRRNLQLEDKVAERTQSLQQTLSSLQTSEKELSRQMQLQSRLVASISHDVRSPINYLATAADLAGEMDDRNNRGEARKLMADVGASARQIFNMVDNMVNFSKSQIYGMHTKARPVLLRALIDEKIRIFRSMLIQRGIVFSNGIPLTLEVSSSQQLLGIMVHNLLDNALKHAPRGSTVKVYADERPDGWHLIFSDTGNGFPDAILQWLNTENSRGASTDESPLEYRGLGLLIVRETATILKIGILAENRAGASIHLIFPQNSDAVSDN